MLEQARLLARAAKSIVEHKVESRALAELLGLETHLGHTERVMQLLNTPEARAGEGLVIGAVVRARADTLAMRERPQEVLRCGVFALGELYRQVENDPQQLETLVNAKAGKKGLSFTQVQKLAQRIGFSTRIIQRTGSEQIPVPSVVHWKVGHYATILEARDGRYLVRDTAQESDFWMRRDVLERQSSGYFLIAEKSHLPAGNWLAATQAQTDRIVGAGPTTASNPHEVGCNCAKKGMPTYTVASMLVSLQVNDMPVGCSPTKGPAVNFALSYNQLDSDQPSLFSFSNVGPLWTHNWLSWVQDDPANLGLNVMTYLPGGGGRPHFSYASSTGTFEPEARTGAVLARIDDKDGLRYERRMADGSVWVYAKSDSSKISPRRFFLTKYIDPQGNAVLLNYDDQLRLSTITDAAGLVTTLEYKNNTLAPNVGYDYNSLLITGWTDPYGRTASIAYDWAGRIVSITDAEGMSSSFTYGVATAAGASTGGSTPTAGSGSSGGGTTAPTTITLDNIATNIVSMTTPYGTTKFSTNYDAQTPRNRWMVITDPLGQSERIEFNPNAVANLVYSEGTVPSASPALYNGWFNYRNTFYWDKNAVAQGLGSDYTKAKITHWAHDAYHYNGASRTSGVIENTKAPLENRIWYTYPGQSSSVYTGSLDKPNGIYRLLDDGSTQKTLKTYNAIGNVTSTTDALGRETDYVYDGNQIDLLQVRQVTASGYDVIASYTYNGQHLPQTFTDAAGQTTTYTYNGSSQLVAVTNPLGQTTTYTYDNLGNLLTEINPNNQVVNSYTYDSAGRMASLTDSEGYTLSYTYDNLDRLTQVQYPDGTSEINTYDKLDIVSRTDRLGQTTTYAYDAERQLVQETDPMGHSLSYTYYPGGQLKTLTDANGHTTQWDIDLQGRVTAKHFADGTQQTLAYENSISRLHSTIDALGQTRVFTYAKDNQLTAINYTKAINATKGVGWGWDNYYPRQTSMTDGTGTTLYTYVPAGSPGALKMATEKGPVANANIAYTYDELGRIQTRTVDTSTETFSYDLLGRLSNHSSALGQFSTDYLGESVQPTQLTVANSPYKTLWSYLDNTDDRRLAAITHTAPSDALVRSYQYQTNVLGQITQRNTWSLNGSVQPSAVDTNHDYTYDPAGNITNIATPSSSTDLIVANTNALQSFGALATTTDAVGNVTDDGEHTYNWDAENRLIEIGYKSAAGQKTNFRYDGQSRRVAIIETAYTGATPVERHYLWCGEEICQERAQDETVTKRFYPEGELWLSGNQRIFYNRDNLGSVRDAQLLNTQTAWSDGTHSSSADFDAYGQGAGNGLSFQYAGMFLHQTSGLYLTHYRAYDPKRARWLSRDPIAENGGVNLYAYVSGDPINKTDPLGLAEFCGTVSTPGNPGHKVPCPPPPPPPPPTPEELQCIADCNVADEATKVGGSLLGTICAGAATTLQGKLVCTGLTAGGTVGSSRLTKQCISNCHKKYCPEVK
nr:RHS repeat-associated core domain-containing protein [Uliginosibacterium gangwonense]